MKSDSSESSSDNRTREIRSFAPPMEVQRHVDVSFPVAQTMSEGTHQARNSRQTKKYDR